MLSKAGQIRAEERVKDINRLNNQVEVIVDNTFLTIDSPDQAQFDELWVLVISSLFDLANGRERDFQLTFNYSCKYLKKIIKQKQWNVFFEVQLNQTTKEPVLRNSAFLEKGFILLNLHREWLAHIKTNNLPTKTNDIFGFFLLSLSFHSGVCERQYLWQITQDLIAKRTIVKIFGGHPYIQFSWSPNRGHFTNDYNNYGEKTFTKKVFLSPITLHLLNYFIHFRTEDWEPPESLVGIQTLMSECLRELGKSIFNNQNNDKLGINYSFPQGDELQMARKNHFKGYADKLYLHQPIINTAIFVLENTGCDLPQPLVHYAMGKLDSSCLPEVFYKNQYLKIAKTKSFADFIKVLVPKKLKKGRTMNNDDFFRKLVLALRQDPSKKTPPGKLREKLIQLIEGGDTLLSEKWLISWYIDLLDKNRASTIRTYHSSVSRRWLMVTDGEDLHSYSSEDFEVLYLRINENIDKGNSYTMKRLIQLHKFGVKRFGIPSIDEDFRQDTHGEEHIRSGFVTEQLFQALLEAVRQMTDANDYQKQLIQAIIILCYRCGLRISEAIKICYRDIMRTSTGDWVYIRSNMVADNKTYSTYRKVPLSAMLLPPEKQIMERFTQRQLSPEALVFSLSKEPLDKKMVAKITQYFLREISGNERIVQHHLRHSCLSRLQLLTLGENNMTLPDFVPYEKKQADEILSLIIAKNEYSEYALAKFAGHGDPEVTYKHYYHFTSYALGKAVMNSSMEIDKTLANNLLGIGRRRFQKLSKNNGQSILLKDTLPLMLRQCKILEKKVSQKKSYNVQNK